MAVQGDHEAVTQHPIPEPPLLQEVATATNLCFPGKHQSLRCSSKNSLLFKAAKWKWNGGVPSAQHKREHTRLLHLLPLP